MKRLILIAAVLLTSCLDQTAPVRVGVKRFTEQEVLGHMLVQLLRNAGHDVDAPITCEDTWRCQEALRDGRIDLMVDYTGTALSYVGAPPSTRTLERVRALYAPLGQRWLDPIGFDNGYRVLVAPDRPWRSVADLAGQDGLRVACPGEYLRRPRDGLAALTARYGLRLAPRPVVIEDPGARYRALREGRADVAIGYATDAAIADAGLRSLTDPLEFFPPYEAAITVRTPALDQHPRLAETLETLSGRIDEATMRQLNGAVQIAGQTPAAAAGQFLAGQKLIDPDRAIDNQRAVLTVAVPADDALGDAPSRARQALRATFPQRAVKLLPTPKPLTALHTGEAGAAVLDGVWFFRRRLRDRLRGRAGLKIDPRVEAAAVIGQSTLHIVRKAGDGQAALAGRVGTLPAHSGSARLLVEALGRAPTHHANLAAAISALRADRVDAVAWLAPPHDPAVTALLADRSLTLAGLDGWFTGARAVAMPYLRAVRIAPGTYPGQPEAVETVGTQVLLAGPARGQPLAEGGGPIGAVTKPAEPFTRAEARQLADAAGVPESPDPALPGTWRRASVGPDDDDGAVVEALLNLLVLLFTGWTVLLALRTDPE